MFVTFDSRAAGIYNNNSNSHSNSHIYGSIVIIVGGGVATATATAASATAAAARRQGDDDGSCIWCSAPQKALGGQCTDDGGAYRRCRFPPQTRSPVRARARAYIPRGGTRKLLLLLFSSPPVSYRRPHRSLAAVRSLFFFFFPRFARDRSASNAPTRVPHALLLSVYTAYEYI